MVLLDRPELSKIFIYPVKSLPGIELSQAIVTKYGIVYPQNKNVIDRKWMIVDENGSFVSQRKFPKMAIIKQRIEGDFIILSAPDKGEARIPINFFGDKIKCRLWSNYLECDSFGIESEISRWLSEILETKNLNLVVANQNIDARKECEFSTFMLLSEESLEDLNSRLEKKVDIVNFRANFVVKNCSAYAEDNWDRIKISNCTFYKTKHCIRCSMITVDPTRGIKSADQQPLKTLKEYRLNKDLYGLSPMFGMYFDLESTKNDSQEQLVSTGECVITIQNGQ